VKNLTTILAGGLLAFTLSVAAVAQEPVPPSGTDTTPDTTVRTDTTTNRANEDFNNDEGFNPGWLGLLGLIGLAGLMPRDRRDRHVHTHDIGATTTRAV
jgi:hypothetical protein